jgi:uncharacterized low-complexity protein
MTKKFQQSPLASVLGTAFVTSLAAGAVSADQNPFALKELDSGYAQLAEGEEAAKEKKEQTCGEGKCGAQMMKNAEMKCGAGMKDMMKQQEAEKSKAVESKCAGMTPPASAPASP